MLKLSKIFFVYFPLFMVLTYFNVLVNRKFSFSYSKLRHGYPHNKECYLVNTNLAGWSKYVTREYFFIFSLLIQDYGWIEWNGSVNGDSIEHVYDLCQKVQPNFILFVEQYQLGTGSDSLSVLNKFKENGTKIGFWQNDFWAWAFNKLTNKQEFLDLFDIWYGPYTYATQAQYRNLQYPRMLWLPNAASPDFDNVSFKYDAFQKILIAGAVGHEYYPIRTWAFNLARKRDEMFLYLSHPGYEALSHENSSHEMINHYTKNKPSVIEGKLVGAEFASFSSKFIAGLTGATRHGALVSKHFEFPAVGMLMISSDDVEFLLNALGFYHMINCIILPRYDPKPTLDWILNIKNRDIVNRIRHQGKNDVLAHHTTRVRAKFLDMSARAEANNNLTYKWPWVSPSEANIENPCPFVSETLAECTKIWMKITNK